MSQFYNPRDSYPIYQPYTNREMENYRAPNPISDVVVPLLLSVVTGFLATLPAIYAWWEWDWPDWLIILTFIMVTGYVWYRLLTRHENRLTTGIEKARCDLPAQPVQPQIIEHQIHIDLTKRNPETGRAFLQRFDLPCEHDVLCDVADAMLAGSTLPESDWTPLKDGKPFSAGSLKKFKDALVTNGLARYINKENPRLGIVLTDDGKAFMQQVKAYPPTDD